MASVFRINFPVVYPPLIWRLPCASRSLKFVPCANIQCIVLVVWTDTANCRLPKRRRHGRRRSLRPRVPSAARTREPILPLRTVFQQDPPCVCLWTSRSAGNHGNISKDKEGFGWGLQALLESLRFSVNELAMLKYTQGTSAPICIRLRNPTTYEGKEGIHIVEWNGDDDGENPVIAGVYLHRIHADSTIIRRNTTLIR
jgi:hypothetical protein